MKYVLNKERIGDWKVWVWALKIFSFTENQGYFIWVTKIDEVGTCDIAERDPLLQPQQQIAQF
jgi:hypothetical protein